MKRQYLYALEEDIASGQFGNNSRLPSFRELAAKYECSIASIKSAVDTLQAKGLVESIHGKGTFFTDRGKVPLPRTERKKIIGAILLRNGWLEAMEAMKLEYQQKGWFLALYDACADMQDPRKEKEFLEMALREGFTGILLAATPIQPVNTRLFSDMRRKGMKIAHIAYYQNDMSHETYFLLDYAAGLEMAVRQAEEHGFSTILPIRDGSRAPVFNLIEQSLQAIKTPLHILETRRCQMKYAEWVSEKKLYDDEQRNREANNAFLPLADLSRDTLILAYRAETAHEILQVFREAGRDPDNCPCVWAVDGVTPRNRDIKTARYDLKQQMTEAMNYLCDNTIDPLQPMRKLFIPKRFGTDKP